MSSSEGVRKLVVGFVQGGRNYFVLEGMLNWKISTATWETPRFHGGTLLWKHADISVPERNKYSVIVG